MYKLYDLDMNEIPFPEGVMPLDFLVGAISKTRETEDIPGRHGVMNYGFNYNSRPVTINMLLTANDRIDFQLLRNEIYALFNIHDEFYIADNLLPSRVLKVAVDESYSPEKFNHVEAEVTITCRTLDSLFWESTYTTLELHDSGYSATAEKYGLVDNIDDEKVQYRFEDNKEILESIDLTNLSYIYGFISGTGSVSHIGIGSYTLNEGFINITKGSTYQFLDEGNNSQINYWWLYMYNDDESFIERISLSGVGDGREYTFIASGTKMKIMINPVAPLSDNRIDPARIGIDVLPELNLLGATKFEVYNAGNVTVEPESAQLYIQLNYVTSDGNLKVTNKTTGESFEYHQPTDRSHIVLDGMVMTVGGVNRFRDSNRRFISLAPGDNEFEITGATFEEIRFEFKYLYK